MRQIIFLFLFGILLASCSGDQGSTSSSTFDDNYEGKEYTKKNINIKDEPGYRFEIKIENWKDTVCYLARYYGDRRLYHDTAQFNSEGVAVFEGKTKKQGGVYIVLMPDNTLFDLVVSDDQHFKISTKGPNYIDNIEVEGSIELEVFYKDIQFISAQREKYEGLQKELESAQTKKDSTDIQEKMKLIDRAVKEERRRVTIEYQDLFFGKMLAVSKPLETPKSIQDSSREYRFEYMHKHYWDGFDFNDPRYLFTDIWHRKIMDYLKNWSYQNPDSLIAATDVVLKGSIKNIEMFQHALRSYLNHFAEMKIMCMDKVYVHLVENYYSKGYAAWLDPDALKKIEEDASFMKYNSCGNVAPNLIMQNNKGGTSNMHQTKSPYIIAFFWDITCGHCKKVAPVLHRLRNVYNKHGVEVFAVATNKEIDKWKSTIKEKALNNWINCIDPEQETAYKYLYGIRSTPRMFLIDKDRKIMAKRLSVGQFAEFLDKELGTNLAQEFLDKDKEIGTDYLENGTKQDI